MFIAEALVPIWTEDDFSLALSASERPVLIVVETLGTTLRGDLLNLGQTSATVHTRDPFLMCSNVRVTIRFRSNDVVYSLSGLTVASDANDNFSVVLDQVTRKNMANMCGGTTGDGVAAVTAPCPETPRKRTKAEQRRVLHLGPPGGIERRIHKRHELEAAATLVVVDKGSVYKCILLELSVSGCRLFYENPIMLEQNTQVEVEFCGRGYPLRLGAAVRMKLDEHLVGLEFSKASMRTRERLGELIAELEAVQKPNCVSTGPRS
jgi:hypothetical protein